MEEILGSITIKISEKTAIKDKEEEEEEEVEVEDE